MEAELQWIDEWMYGRNTIAGRKLELSRAWLRSEWTRCKHKLVGKFAYSKPSVFLFAKEKLLLKSWVTLEVIENLSVRVCGEIRPPKPKCGKIKPICLWKT